MNRMVFKNPYVSLWLGMFLWIPGLCHAQDTKAPDIPNKDESVSLNMPQMGVVDALRMLGKLSGMDMVIDPNVSGAVDLFMEDVSLDDAWKTILDSANLSVSQTGDLLRIKPKTKEQAPATPRETRVIKLKYISLSEMALTGGIETTGNTAGQRQTQTTDSLLPQATQTNEDEQLDQILQKAFQDSITVLKDVRTNHLILSGESRLLDEAQAIIDELDRPIAQILIEAQVVQIRTQAMKDLGIDWGGVYTFENSGNFDFGSTRERAVPGNTATGGETEGISYTSNLAQFNVTLSALIDKGDAQVLFKPRVVTQNNKEAYISSGQEIQIPSGLDINGNASFRERRVVLELGVTPQVMANDLISLSIRVKNDSINYSQPDVSGVPPLDINAVESFITLKNTDTVVIGGILSTQNSRTDSRIPVLSSVPLLGRAFRNESNRTEQAELMVLITPRIISDEDGFIDYERSAGLQPFGIKQWAIDELGKDENLWPTPVPSPGIENASPAESGVESNRKPNKRMRRIFRNY